MKTCRKRNVGTFTELRDRGTVSYDFLASFERTLVPTPSTMHGAPKLHPRGGRPGSRRKPNVAAYMEALLLAAADLRLDDAERAELQSLASRLALAPEEVRAVHAKVFWGMLGRYVEDARIDAREADNMHALRGLLGGLGWAPGDSLD